MAPCLVPPEKRAPPQRPNRAPQLNLAHLRELPLRKAHVYSRFVLWKLSAPRRSDAASMSPRDLVVHVAARGHLGLAGLAGGGARLEVEVVVLVFGRPLQHLLWIDPVNDVERRRVTRGPGLDLRDVDQLDERHLAWMLLGELDILIMQPTEGSPKTDGRTHQGAPEVLARHLDLQAKTLLPALALRRLADVFSHRVELRLGCCPPWISDPAVLDVGDIEDRAKPVSDV